MSELSALCRLAVWSTLAAFIWATAGTAGCGRPEGISTSAEVRARKFIVIDDGGMERAEFGMSEGGEVAMVIGNKKRGTAVWVGTDSEGDSRVAFANTKGEVLLELVMVDEKHPAFIMSDANGLRRLGMVITDTGLVTIRLNDSNKQNRCAISVDEDGYSSIIFRDEKGKTRARLMQHEMGTGSLDLLDQEERPRIVLQVDANGKADAVVFE